MYKNKEDARKYQKGWELKNRLHRNAYQANYNRNIRLSLLVLLGKKCVKCGFDDIRALQVDHVNGGGKNEYDKVRKSINYNKFIIQKILKGSTDYQLLCANCNWIKRHENQEYFK